MLLPRSPGSREPRWAHLLSGPVQSAPEAGGGSAVADVSTHEVAALRAEVRRLSDEVAALRELLHRVTKELGIERT